ncbi:hypothetical protein [Micromonospora chersina]|uniref:hypothetical protein n=1 Tax=Micromonospora chersina TaxID=47854 RepID=UPI003719098E
MFVVADAEADQVNQVMAGLGLPQATSNSLYDNAHWATPLLHGAVTRLLTYGLPALPSGTRVYGHRPMRLLCHLMDLRPPTRALRGERQVPDIDQSLAHLDPQRQAEPEALLAQARAAMANDTQEVVTAVRGVLRRRSGRRDRRRGTGIAGCASPSSAGKSVGKVALADHTEVDSVSTHNLAQELGLVPMTLYERMANKEELLDGMVEVVVGGIDPPADGTDRKSPIRQRILFARGALPRHA